MSAHRILLVEDEPAIADAVQWTLSSEGFEVAWASTWAAARPLLNRCDLAILDVGLPDKSGFDACRELRRDHDFPVIFLTARGEEIDRVVGLEIGADDYVVKPFSPRELTARVQAALRRLARLPATAAAQVLAIGELRLDPTYRTARLEGSELLLTTVEFDLLYTLMRQPGRPFTRDELLDMLRASSEAEAYERTIDVHIKNLRQKLGGAGRHSRFIETVHGVGYRFSV